MYNVQKHNIYTNVPCHKLLDLIYVMVFFFRGLDHVLSFSLNCGHALCYCVFVGREVSTAIQSLEFYCAN
jgi:hypothetical protein